MIKIKVRKKGAVLLRLSNGDQEYLIVRKDKKPELDKYLVAGTYAYKVTGICNKRGYQIDGGMTWNADMHDYYLGELA